MNQALPRFCQDEPVPNPITAHEGRFPGNQIHPHIPNDENVPTRHDRLDHLIRVRDSGTRLSRGRRKHRPGRQRPRHESTLKPLKFSDA